MSCSSLRGSRLILVLSVVKAQSITLIVNNSTDSRYDSLRETTCPLVLNIYFVILIPFISNCKLENVQLPGLKKKYLSSLFYLPLFLLQVWDRLSEDKQIRTLSTITPQVSSELS